MLLGFDKWLLASAGDASKGTRSPGILQHPASHQAHAGDEGTQERLREGLQRKLAFIPLSALCVYGMCSYW